MTTTQGQGEQKGGGINIVSVYSRAVRRHKHACARTHVQSHTLRYAVPVYSLSSSDSLLLFYTHINPCTHTHAHTRAHGVCDPSQKNEW